MLQLQKFPDIPVSTREEARDSRPHPEEPRFRLLAREQGSFTCVVGKEFPAIPSHLKRRHSPQERREELHSRATIPRVPQMSQSIPGRPVVGEMQESTSTRLWLKKTVKASLNLSLTIWQSRIFLPDLSLSFQQGSDLYLSLIALCLLQQPPQFLSYWSSLMRFLHI